MNKPRKAFVAAIKKYAVKRANQDAFYERKRVVLLA